jgi:hypothetical protein
LALSTKKREGKEKSSLKLLSDLIFSIIIVFIIIIGVAVSSPRVFHSGRRKRWIDYGLRVLKTHGRGGTRL